MKNSDDNTELRRTAEELFNELERAHKSIGGVVEFMDFMNSEDPAVASNARGAVDVAANRKAVLDRAREVLRR